MIQKVIAALLLFISFSAHSQNACLDEFIRSNTAIDSAMRSLKLKLNKQGIDTLLCYSNYTSPFGFGWLGTHDWGVVLWKQNNHCFAQKVNIEGISSHKNKIIIHKRKKFNPYLVKFFKGKIGDLRHGPKPVDTTLWCDDCPAHIVKLISQYGNEINCWDSEVDVIENLKNMFGPKQPKHKPFERLKAFIKHRKLEARWKKEQKGN